MICPNYKNKEVFDGFNEIIEAFGGKPMTEEEFRSSELRNQRTGLDYSAMEATYKLYHRNNGNLLDLAPNGKTSILFLTLLSEFGGDRVEAIKAKSAVYSDSFRKWFGDWLQKDKTNVSKVVDENGEPLIVYHGTLAEFSVFDFAKLGEVTGQGYYTDHITGEQIPIDSDYAFFFTDNKNAARSYKNLGIWKQNQFRANVYRNLQAIFLKNLFLFTSFDGKQKEDQKDFINNVVSPYFGFDVLREANALIEGKSSLSEEQIKYYAAKFEEIAAKIENTPEARTVSNIANNLQRHKDELSFIKDHKLDLINGKTIPYFEDSILTISSGYGSWENGDVYLSIVKHEGYYDVLGLTRKPGDFKKITSDNFDDVIKEFERGIHIIEEELKQAEKIGHYDTQGSIISVFLNIKNPLSHDYDGSAFPDKYKKNNKYPTAYIAARQVKKAKNDGNDGVIYKGVRDPFEMNSYGIFNANQVKSAIKNQEIKQPGTGFSTTNDNIYKLESKSVAFLNAENQIGASTFDSVFDPEISARLLDGNFVSSTDLIQSMLNNNAFDSSIEKLAIILQKHNIAVKIDKSLGIGTIAETATGKNGESIILINPNVFLSVSKKYAGITLLHELIHAVTVNAINNPQTKEQKAFVKANKKILNALRKAFKGREYLLNSSEYGAYALTNEKEFAATFITDEEVRNLMYQIARQMDKEGGVILILKDFVNMLSNLLINRSIFASNEEMLAKYHNDFYSFLEGQEMQKTSHSLTNKEIEELCGKEDSVLSANEAIINATKEINELLNTAEYNKLISFRKVKEKDAFENIADRLLTRISALRTSSLSVSKKQAAINNTTKLLDMYLNDHTPRYAALRTTVSSVIPQLLEDLDYLRSVDESDLILSSSDFMYQKHSNFGTYEKIFEDISELIKEKTNEIISEYNSSNKQGSNIDVSDMRELSQDISNIMGAIHSAKTILAIQSNKIVVNQIQKESAQANSLDGAEYAALLLKKHKFEDVSSVWTNFGSIDSSTNEALRILSKMLNDANKTAHAATISVATKLITAAKQLKRGESLEDIYETYKGKKTGYVVREVNFGLFYKEYDTKMEEINAYISKNFGIIRDKDDRRAPDSDGTKKPIKTKLGTKELTATEAWNILRNEWLSENCHRKYTKEYYDEWANVPQCAKDALDDINSQIQSILIQAGAIDEKGYRHLDKLTDKQWKEYNKLQIERKFLYSDYDMFGNKKDENDVSYEIAKALQKLNSKLYPNDKQERIKNEDAWRQARLAIIDDPNKTEDDLRDWDIRNSRLVFRKDEGHDVRKQIEDELDMAKPNYGSEHDAITKQINDLLKPYRLQNGEILADEMTEAIKNLLKSLYKKRNEIELQAANNNTNIKSKRDARNALFKKYIEFEDNAYIDAIRQEYYKQFTDENGNFDEDSFYAAMMEFGFFTDPGDSFLDLYDTFELNTWNKHAVAKDKEKYMKYEPGDGWIDRLDNSMWLNPEFKKYEYYGSTMVPIKEKYANKQWDKIKKQYDPATGKATGSLGNMYKITLDTIKESNNLQTNRIHHDNYMLPLIMASSVRRLIRARSGFRKELRQILCEKLGFRRDLNSYIDAGIGDNVLFDAEGNYIKPKKHVGSYADGRSYNTIPQYYTKLLDDPSMISSDLVNMLISYYRMSKMYNEKSKIKDDCEAIVDRIESSIYTKPSQSGNDDEELLGKSSNSFKAARQFLDMQMYGLYTNRIPLAHGKYEVSITLQTLKQYTTAVNLGMNPKVAAVGFMTAQWVHIINACTGQKYSKRHAFSGFIEVLYRILKSLFGLKYINNGNTNDKLMLLMREANLTQQGDKMGTHTNRNILVLGIVGNLTFGLLSGFDFLSKSNILVTTFKAHKFVDGEFLTFDDIERLRATLSDEEYAKKLTRWSKGVSLYSIFSGKDNKLFIENEQYRNAWNKQRIFLLSRVEKYSEDADGMATQLQKALMTQNFVGAFFLIHRQYLGLMLQQRWGERVYDYDTHQYKNAIFRTAIKYCAELFKNSLFGSGIAGAIAGMAILGTGGGVPAATATLGMIAHAIYRKTHKGSKTKSISEINKEFFGMDSFVKQMVRSLLPFGYRPNYNNPVDEKTYLNQRLNFYDIKRILCEVLLYNLLIAPVAGIVASIADDDDDSFMLQMLAYWMRAFLWESYTPYRPNEVFGAIKSASAVTSPLDKIQNVTNSTLSVVVPYFSMNLLVPSIFGGLHALDGAISNTERDDYYSEEISRGAYSYNEFANLFYDEERGWTRREQSLFKSLPFHNFYEQLKDSKSKRRYIENQIMHIKQDNTNGNSIIDVINYYFGDDK